MPASGLSCVQVEPEQRQVTRQKRRSVDSPSISQRKRSKVDETPKVIEFESPGSNLTCSSCDKSFGSKYLLKKHIKEVHEGILDSGEKKKCESCQELFPTSGGWFTKHLKSCRVPTNETSNDIDIDEVKIEPEMNTCPKCGKGYAPHVQRFLKVKKSTRSTEFSILTKKLVLPKETKST